MLMVCPKRQVSKSKAINQGYYRLQHSASPTYVVGREAGREIQTTLLCMDMKTSCTVVRYRNYIFLYPSGSKREHVNKVRRPVKVEPKRYLISTASRASCADIFGS